MITAINIMRMFVNFMLKQSRQSDIIQRRFPTFVDTNSPTTHGRIRRKAGPAQHGLCARQRKWNFGPICSNFSRLYLVTRGTVCVRINGLEHKLTPGHMYLIPELTTHWDSSDGCFEHYYIHFVDPQHRLMELYRQYELPLEIEATPDMETMVRSVGYDYQEFALKQPQPKTYDNLPGTMTMYKLFEKRSVGQKMRMNSLLQYLLSCFFIKGKGAARSATAVWRASSGTSTGSSTRKFGWTGWPQACACARSGSSASSRSRRA